MNSIQIFSKWIEKRNLKKNQLIMPLDRILVFFGYRGVPLIFLKHYQQICFYTLYWVVSFGLIYSLIVYFLLDIESLQKFIDWRSVVVLLISGLVFAFVVTFSMLKRKKKFFVPDWEEIQE